MGEGGVLNTRVNALVQSILTSVKVIQQANEAGKLDGTGWVERDLQFPDEQLDQIADAIKENETIR